MTAYKSVELVSATSRERADAILSQLAAHKEAWVKVGIPERIAYLRRCIKGVLTVAAPWTEAVCRAKGIDPKAPLAGEEWMSGVMPIVRILRLLIQSLEANGQPQPISWRTRPDGQMVARIFPQDSMDKRMWENFTGEVWMSPGQPATQGAIYREKQSAGRVALVLGAGHNTSSNLTYPLYKLFAENQVALLKMSPVNDYIGYFIEQAFGSLIQDGFLSVVYGDAELSDYLCNHPAIDTVHAIGRRDEDALSITERSQLAKPTIVEPGCVTPVLVVPGRWSKSDLNFHARQIASMVAQNASFSSDAAQVLVTARGWEQREAFLTQVHQELAAIPARKAFYPGLHQRYQAFLERYPQAQPLVRANEDSIPWTVIPNVPPEKGEYALTQQAYCGVLAEVTLDAADAKEFLSQSVTFVNQNVEGTLSCTILMHPDTEKACATELEQAIADLQYGAIGVNVWGGVIYGIGVTPWGSFPSPAGALPSGEETSSELRHPAGHGIVHNSYMFDHPQKSVLHGPFRISPTPGWFVTHKNRLNLGKQVTEFEAAPSWDKLAGIGFAAIQG